MLALDQWRTDHHAMRITAANDHEADLLSRRLPALRHLFGPEVEIQTPGLQAPRLEELLGNAMDAAALEQLLRM